MAIIQHEKFIEIIPTNTYIIDKDRTSLFKGVSGKNINPDDYIDITDEEAEQFLIEQENKNNIETE